jgi:hypothetical protein
MDIMKKSVSIASIDVSTRRKRRVATNLAINLLIKIRFAEQGYLAQMPPQLHGKAEHTAAENAIDALIAATIALSETF